MGPLINGLSSVGATLATLAGLSASMAAFGWDFPPFPLSTEFKHLAQSVYEQQVWILEQQKQTATDLLLQLQIAKSQHEAQGQPVPDYINAGIWEKQQLLQNIETVLQQARQQALSAQQ